MDNLADLKRIADSDQSIAGSVDAAVEAGEATAAYLNTLIRRGCSRKEAMSLTESWLALAFDPGVSFSIETDE